MKTYEETVASLNEMIPEIHENAVAHGWWEGGRDTAEIYALIHSELSEALEEYRDNKPDVYCGSHGSDWCQICYGDTCEIVPEVDCLTCFVQREESGLVPNKPEGLIVELADSVIRIMDYLGKEGMKIKEIHDEAPSNIRGSCAGLIACCHWGVSRAFWCNVQRESEAGHPVKYREDENDALSLVVKWIYEYSSNSLFDLSDVVKVKHSYNKTRSYKHGGKRI